MPNIRILFNTTSPTDLTFGEATIATDGGLTVVLKNGERVLVVPTANILFAQTVPDQQPQPTVVPTS